MMPIGPLMIEHRLIEKMISFMKNEAERIKKTRKADSTFIDTAVDFIRTYADALHHGKEEEILFRDLDKKTLSQEHKRIVDELIEEHKLGRKNVRDLLYAKERCLNGETDAIDDIADALTSISSFYPEHIAKEDKHFFLPIMEYFTKEEQSAMLDEFMTFDRLFIHEKYKKIVTSLQL